MTHSFTFAFALLLLAICTGGSSAIAQDSLHTSRSDRALQAEGRSILLRPDGTWKWVDEKEVGGGSAGRNEEPIVEEPEDIALVRAYLAAPTIEARASYVLDSARTIGLLRSYYGHSYSPETGKRKLIAERTAAGNDGERVVFVDPSNGDGTAVYLKRSKTGWKVDWESTVGLNDVTLVALATTKPSRSTRLRLAGKLFDSKTCEPGHPNPGRYLHLRLGDETTSEYFIVDQDTPMGKRLFELFRDGKRHRVVLEAQWRSMECVYKSGVQLIRSTINGWLITKVVSTDTWVIAEK